MNLSLLYLVALVLGLVCLAGVLLVGSAAGPATRERFRFGGAFSMVFGAVGTVSVAFGFGDGRFARLAVGLVSGAAVVIVFAALEHFGRPRA